MKKILNKRLQTLSAFINEKDVVLDIGCDHGLLGIYLALNKNIKVVGSDINLGPLEKAKENLAKYHLEDKIELRQGDGLETISSDINTIVISGMGGISIINILSNIKKYPYVKKIIVSPNNDFELVRKEISRLSYALEKEAMIEECGKYYLISEYKPGKNKVDSFFGKLNLDDKVVREYYQYIYDTNLKILSNLSENEQQKRNKLIKENKKIENNIK